MSQERERSRAYPIIDLEVAYRLVCQDLRSLGAESLDRERLAKRLGYETGGGGVAARKIGALVQYGFLDRHAGRYSLSFKGREIQKVRRESQEFRAAMESALEHPALFSWVLDRYRRVGKVPDNLAMILTRDYGITERASHEAANVFLRSSRFAGVLTIDGCFSGSRTNWAAEEEVRSEPGPRIEPFEFALTNRRKAFLTFPDVMTDDDIQMLEEGLQFVIQTGRLRKYLQIDPKSAEGNVVPLDLGKRPGRPKA